MMNSETWIAALIAGVFTYLGTRTTTKGTVKSEKLKGEANTEGMYVENMSLILAEYKEQVSGFRQEVKMLREENAELKDDFSQFKQSHYTEVREYKNIIANKDERIEELETENTALKIEVTQLKEVE